MSCLLHYPRRTQTLNDFAHKACTDAIEADDYVNVLATANRQSANSNLVKNSPIIIPNGKVLQPPLAQLTRQEHERLSVLSHNIGGAGVMALADLAWEIKNGVQNNATTFTSGAGAALTKTSSHLLNTINDYQKELKAYEDLRNHRATKTTLARQNLKLEKAYKQMSNSLNSKGQQFLHKHTVKTREVKNLNGRIVRESIPITDHGYVKKLSTFAKAGKVAGPGMVFLDGYLRYDKVKTMYENNHPQRERQAIIEATSFTAGVAIAGTIATFVLFAVPGGLVLGLVAGGVAAVISDNLVKTGVGVVYDKVYK